jgi:hypothetical protein
MRKWDILYLATMKSDKKSLKEFIAKVVKDYLAEAEKEEKADAGEEAAGEAEENPFASAEGGAEDEKGAGDKEDKKDEKGAKSEEPTGIPLQFDISKVKQYNKANFLSDKGIVKSIDKRGIVVTTQPDGVDVLVNFSDISENVKTFFKKKK